MTLLFIIQILCLVIFFYFMNEEIRYCKHKNWCWTPGYIVASIFALIPVFGILICLGGIIDFYRNVKETINE